mgnify:CR=1 FL=1|tara:strand:- start:1292 stop:1780 length:489 start_codon:yes stop_codon:yes gene_type:complete
MKTSLYKINTDLLELFSEIEANEGVLTDEQSEQLEIKQGQLESKSIAYLEVIKTQESFESRIDEEIKRLTAMKRTSTNIVKKLKNNLIQAVHLFGEFDVGLHTFKLRKSEQVNCSDINSLPSAYKTTKVTESADKKAIKEALKAGVKLENCEIVINYGLNIK